MEKSNQSSAIEFIFLAFTNSIKFPILHFIFILIIYLVIIAGNVLLMLIIKADFNLHTPMYLFIFNLSLLDICYMTSLIPQTLVNLLRVRPTISISRCAAQMFFIIVFGANQICVITVMAYDRYVAISNPLRYKTIMNWAACRTLLLIAWTFSSFAAFGIVASIFILPFCDPLEIEHFYCDIGQVLRLACPSIQVHELVEGVTFIFGLGMLTIPFLLIFTSYMFIIDAILKIHTNKGRLKTFSTCSSHLSVVAVGYACLGFMYFRPKTAYSMDKDKVFVIGFSLTMPILNPVIYSMKNRAVKSGFIKLMSY